MSEINSSAVTLPAGSYDYDALKKGSDKAAKGSAGNYEEALAKAIDDSSSNAFETVDPRMTPGYVMKEVENSIGSIELIQVYDPGLADKISEADAGVIVASPLTTHAAAEAEAASKE